MEREFGRPWLRFLPNLTARVPRIGIYPTHVHPTRRAGFDFGRNQNEPQCYIRKMAFLHSGSVNSGLRVWIGSLDVRMAPALP